MTSARVIVEGVPADTPASRPVARLHLGHGESPEAALAAAGWHTVGPLSVGSRAYPHWQVTVRYAVRPAPAVETPGQPGPLEMDPDLTAAEVAGAVPYQRVAAYAVARSARGVLLAQLSDRTNAPGMWNLPGGGLDDREDPIDALHREVWEETDQRVTHPRLVAVRSRRWIGRAPNGRVEDFHAVRFIYAAQCPEPTDPIVNEIDGSTAQARWFALDELDEVPMTPAIARTLAEVLGPD